MSSDDEVKYGKPPMQNQFGNNITRIGGPTRSEVLAETKRRRGRPRKVSDRFPNFVRLCNVLTEYDGARQSGDKHSAAVQHCVTVIKQRYPTLKISKSEVKRILASSRPRGAQIVLIAERKQLNDEEIAKRRLMHERIAILQGLPSITDAPISSEKFVFGYGKRPSYPRHNRKGPDRTDPK